MATRRRKRYLRSPIEPGAMQISAKTLFSMIPLVIMLFALVGSWYVQKDRQDRLDKEVSILTDTVARLEREHAAEAGNGVVIEKIRDDVSTIKADVARLRAKLE